MHEHLGKLFQHTFTTLGDDVKSFPLCQTLYHSEANTEANVQEWNEGKNRNKTDLEV